MKKELIEFCKQKLLMMKREHEAILSRPSSNSIAKGEIIDMGSSVSSFEISHLIRKRKQVILNEINLALYRIKDGTFGFCQNTGEPISEKRLRAIPWTRISTLSEEDLPKVS